MATSSHYGYAVLFSQQHKCDAHHIAVPLIGIPTRQRPSMFRGWNGLTFLAKCAALGD